MPDYGHELLFGTFITPATDAPGRVLTLAEATGLDLATLQGHLDNPGFLDTWTLPIAPGRQRRKPR